MPPRMWSRHQFTSGVTDDDGAWFLNDRERFPFRDYRDNRVHVVREGDTLFSLAGIYFRGLTRPCGLWWVIADFQPDPIHDPTLALQPGRALFIPSTRTVVEDVFNRRRYVEAPP